MNIINKLTIRHLKNNISRTILTIIGICVSVSMITSVFTGVYSYLDYAGRVFIHSGGDYHFTVSSPTDKLNDILGNDERIESYGIKYELDTKSFGYHLKGAKFKFNSTGSWYSGNKECLEMIVTTDYDGTLPESSNEILVEEKFIADNELDWKIGDTVSIESGRRYIGDYAYMTFSKNGPYQLNEKFEYSSTDNYKITGILHGNAPTSKNGTMLIRGEVKDHKGSATAIVKLKRLTPASIIEINRIVDKFGFSEDDRVFNISTNSDYLQTRLVLDRDSDMIFRLLPICTLVLLMIIATSMVLIYNSFGMSLDERIKYLGMLASVGATRKQKKKSVIYEALTLSAVGIPLGIALGHTVIAILFFLIGERIKTSALSGNLDSSSEIALNVKGSFIIIAAVAIIGILSVLLSSLIPSRKASTVSPIDAIRQSDEIKIRHKVRTPFFVKKIFGYEGELAYKNMKRNGAKSKIIVSSIALSLVLFLGCNYFCNLFVISTGIDKEIPYQVSVCFDSGEKHKEYFNFLKLLESNKDVKRYYSIQEDGISPLIQIDYNFSKGYLDELLNEKNFTTEYKELADYDGFINYRAIDDESFNEICKNNNIDYRELYDYDYGYRDYDEDIGYLTKLPVRVLLVNDYNHTLENSGKPFNENVIGAYQGYDANRESEDFKNLVIETADEYGNAEDMSVYEEMVAEEMTNKKVYEIYGLVDYEEDNVFFNLDGTNSITAFYPYSVYMNLYGPTQYEEGTSIDLGIETESHAQLTKTLTEYFESNEISATVFDEAQARDSIRATILVLKVMIYGFIILMSIITVTNIINTIANSINHRKKEFAMLKSVGLTPKGFRRMLSFESLFYALEGIIIGMPLSVLICFAINKLMKIVTVPFVMDIKMCIISIIVVFAIIGLTMLYSSAKVRKNSIIEELKIEIN